MTLVFTLLLLLFGACHPNHSLLCKNMQKWLFLWTGSKKSNKALKAFVQSNRWNLLEKTCLD